MHLTMNEKEQTVNLVRGEWNYWWKHRRVFICKDEKRIAISGGTVELVGNHSKANPQRRQLQHEKNIGGHIQKRTGWGEI